MKRKTSKKTITVPKNSLLYLDELELDEPVKQKVKDWIMGWVLEFQRRADGQQGEVRKLDWKHDDVFFFTDCRDILDKDMKDVKEDDIGRIGRRKQNILIQLLLRQLMSDTVKVEESSCSHCGFKPMEIHSCSDGGLGYFHLCPRCGQIVLVSNIMGFSGSAIGVSDFIGKHILKDGKNKVLQNSGGDDFYA